MELRKGEPGDVEGVAASLARAFDDDPWVDWLVRKDARRAEAILGFFRLTYGRMAMRWRESWVDPALRGAAMWAPPGQWHLSFLAELGAFPAVARSVTLRRVWSVWRATQPIARAHPPEDRKSGGWGKSVGLGGGRIIKKKNRQRRVEQG